MVYWIEFLIMLQICSVFCSISLPTRVIKKYVYLPLPCAPKVPSGVFWIMNIASSITHSVPPSNWCKYTNCIFVPCNHDMASYYSLLWPQRGIIKLLLSVSVSVCVSELRDGWIGILKLIWYSQNLGVFAPFEIFNILQNCHFPKYKKFLITSWIW